MMFPGKVGQGEVWTEDYLIQEDVLKGGRALDQPSEILLIGEHIGD